MRTYFGLEVIRGKMVRLVDIEALPFADFWRESAIGSTMPHDSATGETLVYLHDWERFCRLFIETGLNRFSSETTSRENTLPELLEQLAKFGPREFTDEDRQWLDAPPVGKEVS